MSRDCDVFARPPLEERGRTEESMRQAGACISCVRVRYPLVPLVGSQAAKPEDQTGLATLLLQGKLDRFYSPNVRDEIARAEL